MADTMEVPSRLLDRLRAFGQRKPKASAFKVQAAAGDTEATVWVYGEIGSFWGVEAEPLVRQIAALQVETIHVRINSMGGDVFQAMAIYNALRRQTAQIVTHIDGVAASAGSLVAMAGDEIRIAEGAFLMIHDPWFFVVGNAAELRETADLLDTVADAMAAIYAKRSGKTDDEARDIMRAETWYNAADAIANGFADSTEEGDSDPTLSASLDLSMFAKVPAELRAAGAQAPAATQKPQTIREFETALREKLGYSRAEAKSIAARAYKAATDPRDEEDEQPANTDSADAEHLLAAVLSARMTFGRRD